MKYLIFVTMVLCGLGAWGQTNSNIKKDNEWIIQSDFEAYQLAIEDLSSAHPKVYPNIHKLLNGIDQLKQLKSKLGKGIKSSVSEINAAKNIKKTLDLALLANPLLANKKILVIKRDLGESARHAMSGGIGLAPTNFQNNSEISHPAEGWKNTINILSVQDGILKENQLFKPPKGHLLKDIDLHFSGKKLMFSAIGTHNRWHLFELDINKNSTSQLTPEDISDYDSFDGCYLPDGRIVFCSTATFLGLPCTNGGNKMCGIFQLDPGTNNIRQLTFDQDSNWDPVVLENGKLMYLRWEYADLPHSNSRIVFTMNPDGTGQQAYYGSNSYFPTSLFGARQIPDHPTAFAGIASGHHSVSRSGRLILLDPAKGRQEADGVITEIPHRGRIVDAIARDRLPDGVWPQFLTPYPLSEKYFLVSVKKSPESLWGIYLVDVFNNMTLIAEEEGMAYIEAQILEARKQAHIIPDRIDLENDKATVFIQDIYEGGGLKGIPRGEISSLRVGTYHFSPLGQGGLLGTIGMDGPWDIKRILGTVPVESDGSAFFEIPANTPVFVQALDREGKAVQLMRSWFTGMPGERISCIGCHEDKNTIPIPKMTLAARKSVDPITPFYGKERGFSYRHEVQPVLDRYCIRCHDGETPGVPYLKGDKMISDWDSQIAGKAARDYGGHFSESYAQLHRFVRRPGIESDMHMLVPMDVHADQTELMQILNKGHHGVNLDKESTDKLICWIDFNAPFHGRRSDIPNYKNAESSIASKLVYGPKLGGPNTDYEYLPEIKKISPAPSGESIPETQKNYPKPGKWAFPANQAWGKQIALGNHQISIPLADGITLELVKVPAGKFAMGSELQADEQPVHEVEIEKEFWIGRFEISNEQFALFDPDHDSRHEHRHGYQFGRKGYPLNDPDQPVVRISWEEAMAYCNWLSNETGLNITLPTEAQWEWACRAGSETPFWFGNLDADYTNFANLGDRKLKEFAACTAHKHYESVRIIDNPNRYDDWIPRDTVYNDGGFVSEEIGRYRRSPWELFDMHGNVWEWTLTSYRPYPYSEDGRNKPDGSQKRVARGGSWYDRPFKATSSYRLPYRPYQMVFNVGFRVVLNEN
ncbi:MAG: SUMF1/EgtB/PvdO family nonheme iron enzyme [Bacteroidetes bacterium]|nr:SUMF1/EgtB/PvdO family nonheme iron enzyme [Bacteroidota bacterium]